MIIRKLLDYVFTREELKQLDNLMPESTKMKREKYQESAVKQDDYQTLTTYNELDTVSEPPSPFLFKPSADTPRAFFPPIPLAWLNPPDPSTKNNHLATPDSSGHHALRPG